MVGATNSVPMLATLKARYEKAAADLDGTLRSRTQDALAAYGQGLSLALASLKKEGDLDGVLLMQKELERFAAGNSLPDASGLAGRGPIDRLAETSRKAIDSARTDHQKSLLALNQQYVAALRNQVRALTKANDIEQAITLNDEIKRIEAESATPHETLPSATTRAAPAPPVAKVDVVLQTGQMKGLVLYYTFDRDERGKVADKSRKSNDGKADGGQWTPRGKIGGAYDFNGRDTRIMIGNAASLDFGPGARTIGAWIQSHGASRDYQAIFAKGTNPGYAFRLKPSPDRAIEYFKSADGRYSFFTFSNTITDNAWHHLLVVDHGNGTVDLYKDGALLETIAKTNYDSDSSEKAAVGALPVATYGHIFNGLIDEVMVFDRALAEGEIRQIYDAQK
jgi:hypothetical protein